MIGFGHIFNTEIVWNFVRVLLVLRCTSDACLKFSKTVKGLAGYMDLDFAADLDKCMSVCLSNW